MEDQIINEAVKLGFVSAGIARAGPAETIDVFSKWVSSGQAAEMHYLKRNLDLRANPLDLAPGTRSVIVVAAQYPVNKQPGKGFSACALNMDYHIAIKSRLKQLSEFIKSRTRINVARICVDSAPILEREWAIRAGIGWRGKQGQIVGPACGSCILLGILLVDLELAPSDPIPSQCGNCNLCIEACPTGALNKDGTLDARKCVSYLTIEHKEKIHPHIQPLMGQSLFGCDICTAVCPLNKQENNAVMPELREKHMPDIKQCLAMTEEEFNNRFRNTAVQRTGFQRLRRNAQIALNNLPQSAL